MKRRVRLTEGDLHKIVGKTVKRILREDVEYTNLYNEIQNVANNIQDFCEPKAMGNTMSDSYTKVLKRRLRYLANELVNAAADLEEHLSLARG